MNKKDIIGSIGLGNMLSACQLKELMDNFESPKRFEFESFEEYRVRRKVVKKLAKEYLSGKYVEVSGNKK